MIRIGYPGFAHIVSSYLISFTRTFLHCTAERPAP